jgi:hypothetical protein
LPRGFNTPLLAEYFTSIAHTYSVQQRYLLKEIQNYSPQFEELSKTWKTTGNKFTISISCLEIIHTSATCIGICDQFLDSKEFRSNSEALLKYLEFSDIEITMFLMLCNNAESKNAILDV